MNKIEKYFAQKKEWKIEKFNKETQRWENTVLGEIPMRHGEANIHKRSAKLLGHSPIRIVKLKNILRGL